jgi:hypothetical protein
MLRYFTGIFFCLIIFVSNRVAAQEEVVKDPIVRLHYYNSNNSFQYILVESLLKAGKKFEPQKLKTIQLYLDSNIVDNLIGKVVTDEKGKAIITLPPQLKAIWNGAASHNFIAIEDGNQFELPITKSRISMDTSSSEGSRSVTVHVDQFVKGEWIVAPDVEMKIGVKRHGGILPAGDDVTSTTDSTGSVTVEFNKDSLPGDQKGIITLIARTEDHESFGNIITEKKCAWGKATIPDTHFFDQRTLWTRQSRTPYWLLGIAYCMVFAVWGTLIYLVMQMLKIRRLGKLDTD